MARPGNPHRREITTKDDVPLRTILDYGTNLLDLYRDADRAFVDSVSTEVDSRTFLTHTGDMEWEELAEGEHARTGSLSERQMAFSVKTYGHSLGFTREFFEDNPSELAREQIQEMISGAEDKRFEVLFDVLKNGVADGTELWYDPGSYGAYSFDRTHDHTFADGSELFGDEDQHRPSAWVGAANSQLTHHGLSGDFMLVSSDVKREFVDQYIYDSQYVIPTVEDLLGTALPEQTLTIDGTRILQTAWLDGRDTYTVAAGKNPIKTNTPRPAEFTDNTGAPIGGAGGSYGDPGALLGAYGSMRFGAKMVDPLAAVKVTMPEDDVLPPQTR